jgi:hypothetical protein
VLLPTPGVTPLYHGKIPEVVMTYLDSLPLEWILILLVIAVFLGGCVWRMSYGARDNRRNPRRD